MRRLKTMALLGAFTIMACGCGSKVEDAPAAGVSMEEVTQDVSSQNELKTPAVNNGIMEPGEESLSGSATQEEADKLFAKAINGEIIVNASYEGEDCSFFITDLPSDPEEWDSYSVGERVDLDNDGVTELIINGPYGGKYLDARDGGVYQLAEGEGTAGQLCYAEYDGNTYICHVDNSHGGRETFMMDQYNGNGDIVEATSLTAEYWDYVEFTAEAAVCHFGGEEIPVERYLELRKEIFKY